MKLLKLKLHQFQGIERLELDFPDGCSGSIYGDNATGKTTVYNALTWLIFGGSSTLTKNFSPKTKGAEGDLHHLEHSVEAVFAEDNGRLVTLAKTFKEVYKKKRGSRQEEFTGHAVYYSLDGVPVKEKEYQAAVMGFCGGDCEKAKMLTMPSYFAEVISWEARRKILLKVCGDLSDSEIIANNPELEGLLDFLKMPGTEDQYYSVDELRKIAASRKSEISKKLADIPGRIDEAGRAFPDIAGLNSEELANNLAALNSQKEQLSQERSWALAGGYGDLQRKAVAIKTQMLENKANHLQRQNELNADIEAEILLLRREIGENDRQVEDLKINLQRGKDRLQNLVQTRLGLLELYQEISSRTWDEGKAICPTCHQALPAEQIEKMRAEFNLGKSKKLEEINFRGQREASKTQIAELEQKLTEIQASITEASKKQAKLLEQAKQLEGQRTEPVAYESTEEYRALKDQLTELQVKAENETQNTAEATAVLDDKIKAVEEAIREIQAQQTNFAVAKTQQARITELESIEKALGAEFEKLEESLHYCDLFIKAKVSSLSEKINGKFQRVSFRLFQEQINGGIKSDCEVMIPSPSGKLVPYSTANDAAKINAGLEIIKTLSEHWGIRMPVFIDNAESVTKLLELDTQLIRLVVSEADKRLQLLTGESDKRFQLELEKQLTEWRAEVLSQCSA